MKKSLWANVLTLAVIAALALPVMGQAGGDPAAGGAGAGAGGRGGRGGRGAGAGAGAGFGGGQGRGAFDPTARVEAMRATLAPASDDEWKVLSDKLLKVLTLQAQLNAGRQQGGGRGGRGGGGGGGQPPTADPANPVSVAAVALTTSVADTAAPADGLKTQMAALRDARKKVQGLLTTAQEDLKTVVSVRQEAVLVTQGILE